MRQLKTVKQRTGARYLKRLKAAGIGSAELSHRKRREARRGR